MRWFVEISPLGQAQEPGKRLCVEATQWQPALQKARTLNGEQGSLGTFSIELLDEGYRAIDPVSRLGYVVRRAPDDAELSEGGVAAQAPAAAGEAAAATDGAPEAQGKGAPAKTRGRTTTLIYDAPVLNPTAAAAAPAMPAVLAALAAPTAPTAPTGAAPTATAAASAVAASTAAAQAPACPEGTVLVPGGKFFMGSDDPAFKLWQPAHKVTIDSFCIDIHEVTAARYKDCTDIGECKTPPEVPDFPKVDPAMSDADHEALKQKLAEQCTFGKPGLEQHPVNCVSWTLADAYCRVQKKRLPTEAEWEYAARGSDGRKFPWGNDPGDHTFMNTCGAECNAWEKARGLKPSPRMYDVDDGYSGTAPVGSFPKGKTKFGTFDVVGNVWEWTADWYATYKDEEQVNPKGAPAGDRKAMRGGGYNGGFTLWVNPAFRYHQLATASAPGIGFRCAKDL